MKARNIVPIAVLSALACVSCSEDEDTTQQQTPDKKAQNTEVTHATKEVRELTDCILNTPSDDGRFSKLSSFHRSTTDGSGGIEFGRQKIRSFYFEDDEIDVTVYVNSIPEGLEKGWPDISRLSLGVTPKEAEDPIAGKWYHDDDVDGELDAAGSDVDPENNFVDRKHWRGDKAKNLSSRMARQEEFNARVRQALKECKGH